MSGLRNQACHDPSESPCDDPNTERNEKSPTPATDIEASNDEVDWDTMRSQEDEEEEILYRELGNDSPIEEDLDCEAIWEDKGLQDWLVALAVRDPKDGD